MIFKSLKPLRYILRELRPVRNYSIMKINPIQNEAMNNDICLLVDKNDHIVGTASKKECHTVGPNNRVPLHRAFSLFLFNKKGELILQRRSPQKVTYPNHYTNICCSHQLYINGKPEDTITAVRRRLNYELGVPFNEVAPGEFKFVARIMYEDPGDYEWGEHELAHMIILHTDITLEPNPEEISEIITIPREAYKSLLASSITPLTPWFSLINKSLLNHWWDNLHRLEEIAEPEVIQNLGKVAK